MPTIPINVVQDVGTLPDAFNELAKLQKQLRYLVNGNVDFENVRARSIKAENIEVGTLTAEEIKTNTITADRMNVNELSAIAANLGHITAGLIEAVNIIGSYIATANGTYPRCEMSATKNLFVAYADENNFVRFVPFHTNGKPAFLFTSGDVDVGVISAPDELQVNGLFGLRLTGGTGPVTLSTNSLDGIRFDSWGEIRNQASGHSLKQDLDALTVSIGSLTAAIAGKATAGASTGSTGGWNGGIPIGTNLVTTTGTVTWSGIPSHSHSQN